MWGVDEIILMDRHLELIALVYFCMFKTFSNKKSPYLIVTFHLVLVGKKEIITFTNIKAHGVL